MNALSLKCLNSQHHSGSQQCFTDAMHETPGQRLKRLRNEKGMTQAKLASASGIGQSAIGNIESGIRGYGSSIVAIAKALGATPEHLQTGEMPHQPSATPPEYKSNQPLALTGLAPAAINLDNNQAARLDHALEVLRAALMERGDDELVGIADELRLFALAPGDTRSMTRILATLHSPPVHLSKQA